MDAFAHALGDALGRPAALRVPSFAVRLALGARSEAVLSGQRAVPKRLVDEVLRSSSRSTLASALADIVSKEP